MDRDAERRFNVPVPSNIQRPGEARIADAGLAIEIERPARQQAWRQKCPGRILPKAKPRSQDFHIEVDAAGFGVGSEESGAVIQRPHSELILRPDGRRPGTRLVCPARQRRQNKRQGSDSKSSPQAPIVSIVNPKHLRARSKYTQYGLIPAISSRR